jgi:hypothetical protein
MKGRLYLTNFCGQVGGKEIHLILKIKSISQDLDSVKKLSNSCLLILIYKMLTILHGDIQIAAQALVNAKDDPFEDPTDSEGFNDE